MNKFIFSIALLCFGQPAIAAMQGLGSGSSTGSGAPTGAAGGDLSGTYPNPQVKGATILPGFTATVPSSFTATGNTQYSAAFSSGAVLTGSNTGLVLPSAGYISFNGVILNSATPTPGGAASGDLAGSYPSPKVSSATTGTFTLSAGSTIATGGVLVFSTAPSAATTFIPAMFIDNSGSVGISTNAGLGPLPGKFYVDGNDPNMDAVVADFNNAKTAFLARKGDTKITYFKADINGVGFAAQVKGNSSQSATCTSPLFADSANNGLCSDNSIIGLTTNGVARLSVANAGAVTVTSSFTVAAASASVAYNFTATTGTFSGTGGYSLFLASGAWIQDGVLKVKEIDWSDLSVSTTGRSGTAGGGSSGLTKITISSKQFTTDTTATNTSFSTCKTTVAVTTSANASIEVSVAWSYLNDNATGTVESFLLLDGAYFPGHGTDNSMSRMNTQTANQVMTRTDGPYDSGQVSAGVHYICWGIDTTAGTTTIYGQTANVQMTAWPTF